MSKINIGLILSKSFTVLKKQPFIFIPFLILGFLSGILVVATFDYSVEMANTFQDFGYGQQYTYTMTPGEVFKDMADVFGGMVNLLIISLIGGIILWIIQIFLYTGTVSMIMDVIEGQKTGTLGNFINISCSRGIIVLLSTILANIIVFLPGMIGILIIMIAALSMSEETIILGIIIGPVCFAFQFLWLLAILFFLSSKIPRLIYIVTIAITLALMFLGIFFLPLMLLAIPFLFLLFILVAISIFIISYAIDYIIPSAVVIDNQGVVNALKKSYLFAKENTIHFGILILISIAIIIAFAMPFGILSVIMQMGDAVGGDFYSPEPQVYVPTTADLVIPVVEVFVITGLLMPFILVMLVLSYVNATRGKEILEKLE